MDVKDCFHSDAYRMRETADARLFPAPEAWPYTVAWLNCERWPIQVSGTALEMGELQRGNLPALEKAIQ